MAGSRKSPRTHCLRQASKVSTAYSDIQECHEFHGKEKQLKGKKTCSCGSASYSERNYLCYSSCQNSVGSIRGNLKSIVCCIIFSIFLSASAAWLSWSYQLFH